jgi:multidrug resistance efflux pump
VGAGGRGRKLGHIGLRVRILAAHSDLGLCRCPRKAAGEALIVLLLNSYIALLALFVWLRFIPFNLFWKLSPVIVLLALLIGLFVPMGWGALSGPAVVMRNSVEIIPGVSGSVVDVPIEPNKPIKAGEVLFKIDPVAYQAALDQYSAQLQRDQALLAKDQTNLQRYQQLVAQNSIARQQEEARSISLIRTRRTSDSITR